MTRNRAFWIKAALLGQSANAVRKVTTDLGRLSWSPTSALVKNQTKDRVDRDLRQVNLPIRNRVLRHD